MGPKTDLFTRARRSGLLAACLLTALLLGWHAPAHAEGAVRSGQGDWESRCVTPPGALAKRGAGI